VLCSRSVCVYVREYALVIHFVYVFEARIPLQIDTICLSALQPLYVCMFVRMYARVIGFVYVFICVYVCMYVCTCNWFLCMYLKRELRFIIVTVRDSSTPVPCFLIGHFPQTSPIISGSFANALSRRSIFAKEPLIIGLICGKWPMKRDCEYYEVDFDYYRVAKTQFVTNWEFVTNWPNSWLFCGSSPPCNSHSAWVLRTRSIMS